MKNVYFSPHKIHTSYDRNLFLLLKYLTPYLPPSSITSCFFGYITYLVYYFFGLRITTNIPQTNSTQSITHPTDTHDIERILLERTIYQKIATPRTRENIHETIKIIIRLKRSDTCVFSGIRPKSSQSRNFIASTRSIREKNDTIANTANTEIQARNSPITERILLEISRTTESIFSISMNVTWGPELARIVCFQLSESVVQVETKQVLGALRNASGSNEK